MAKYKKYAKPFLPIRFPNLLPLSHMFGQAMATFVPPMLPGTVVFTRSFAPEDIVRQIRSRRISVLVCVPKMLDVLREHILRVAPEARDAPEKMHWTKRWWRYRRIHRMFGFKFWAIVVGAAPLDPELEAFFGRLGFLVIQGYGLTETAPIVTLNHPLRSSRGAVGKPIAGVEIRIAEDGEILVRGENVTGYYGDAGGAVSRRGCNRRHRRSRRGRKASIRGARRNDCHAGGRTLSGRVEARLNEVPGIADRPRRAPMADRPPSACRRWWSRQPASIDDVVRQANAAQRSSEIRAAASARAELPRTEGRAVERSERGSAAEPGARRRAGGVGSASTAGRGDPTPRRSSNGLAPGRTIGHRDHRRARLSRSTSGLGWPRESMQCNVDESRFAAATQLADSRRYAAALGAAAADIHGRRSIEFPRGTAPPPSGAPPGSRRSGSCRSRSCS